MHGTTWLEQEGLLAQEVLERLDRDWCERVVGRLRLRMRYLARQPPGLRREIDQADLPDFCLATAASSGHDLISGRASCTVFLVARCASTSPVNALVIDPIRMTVSPPGALLPFVNGVVIP